jgi:DNA uptake protein ComE-like DNA-binding protein
MNNIIKYFDFNRSEQTGILVLVVLILAVLLLPIWLKPNQTDDKAEVNRFLSDLEQFNKTLVKANDSISDFKSIDYQQIDKSVASNKITPFSFDPNKMDKESWAKLGLNAWQIKIIENYKAKGGKYYKKEDFKRMFCISPEEYQLLEPYILIADNKQISTKPITYEKPVTKKAIIELNSADSATLTTLYGIGPSFAKRILKFRNVLGGFYSKKQLLEVYGFDNEKYMQIEPQCVVDLSGIKKININKARVDDLKKHPYFDYYTAKAIVDKRIMLRRFSSLNQLKEIPLIHEELFEKIKNYLTLE